MFKLNWIGSIALGLAVITGIGISFFYFLNYQQHQANDRISAANDYAAATDERPESCGTIMSEGSFFDWLACFGDNITAPESQKASEYDLKAQQDMAAWALGMLIITFWLTIITFGGVFFVWRTLKATREMAIDTRNAVEATWKIGKKQTKAYLSISSVEIKMNIIGEKADITIDVNFVNSGNSPAIEPWVSVSVSNFDEGAFASDVRPDTGHGLSDTSRHNISCDLADLGPRQSDGRYHIDVNVRIEAEDVFEDEIFVKDTFWAKVPNNAPKSTAMRQARNVGIVVKC